MTRALEFRIRPLSIFAGSGNQWEAIFASFILMQSRRIGWKPTPKQKAITQRMGIEVFRPTHDITVMEDE